MGPFRATGRKTPSRLADSRLADWLADSSFRRLESRARFTLYTTPHRQTGAPFQTKSHLRFFWTHRIEASAVSTR
eukprot:1078349-Prorocentrum_minimum.AAC.3